MKICSLYGAGFYYIPGTDTCLKLSGYVRAETDWNAAHGNAVLKTIHDTRADNLESNRARGAFRVDARSQTAYGTLRSYFNLQGQFQNGSHGNFNQSRAFIQWAGFTLGQATSDFDFFSFAHYSDQINVITSDTGGVGDWVMQYTAQMGNGFSGTLGVEDTSARQTNVFDAAGTGYAGRGYPDVVGNLRIDQAWGSAQVMGAVHQVRGAYDGNTAGWAVGGGLKVNLPWGHGDNVSTQVAYSQGALKYLGSGLGNFSIAQSGTTATAKVYDGVWTGSSLDLTSGWSVGAGVMHNWSSQWGTSLYGGYAAINYGSAANTAIGYTNADFSFWQIGSRTMWKPVHNLDFSIDVMYNNLDGADTGTASTTAHHGWVQGVFRVNRHF